MATVTAVKNKRSSRSTIALKLLMALSGLIFIGYVLAHMYGNLKAFSGQEAFDSYAEHLRTIGEPLLPYSGLLWIIRIVLLVALAVHVYAAYTLWARAGKARTTKYAVTKRVNSTWSSKTMRWGGTALLLFIVFHILHFTLRVVTPGSNSDSPYERLVGSFEIWWVSAIYLVAMAALAMHLRHGTWSAAQTLGLTNTASARRNANLLGYLLAVVIAGGYSLIPVFVLAGVIS
ncbi:succinate dehydrogenase cytochrome b subunit [uncultured Nocardioides sp.]|uniref:succinate dehydrogenase cytochrome b subunit n=1 Tax=uncultured Nocardioides sp. TaxID=198441 RepID=UPI00261B4288|nr:succinate dehydrogenase cytochrome b subunit [uncultured Nocardioides sp.]